MPTGEDDRFVVRVPPHNEVHPVGSAEDLNDSASPYRLAARTAYLDPIAGPRRRWS